MAVPSWDARLAGWLVRPLGDGPITPNHLTTARLLLGLTAAAAFAAGPLAWANRGAWLFVLSNLLDHADGELARSSGRATALGHHYDLASDTVVHVLLFAGLGYGLRGSWLGGWALPMGIAAGLCVGLIVWLHTDMERRLGREGARLPALAGFEMEDILYLLPLVTLWDGREGLLIAAAIGAPVFALWLVWYAGRLAGEGAGGRTGP